MFFLFYNVVSNVMRIIVNIYVLVYILNCQQVCFYYGAFVVLRGLRLPICLSSFCSLPIAKIV